MVDSFLNDIANALHISGLKDQLVQLFNLDQFTSSNTALSNNATSASKINDVCLKIYVATIFMYVFKPISISIGLCI